MQQEQVLDGAFGRGTVLVVAKPRQPAFDDFTPARAVGSGRVSILAPILSS